MEQRASFWNAETDLVKSILTLDPELGTFNNLQDNLKNLPPTTYIQITPMTDTGINVFWVTPLDVDLNPVELKLAVQRRDIGKQLTYPLLIE